MCFFFKCPKMSQGFYIKVRNRVLFLLHPITRHAWLMLVLLKNHNGGDGQSQNKVSKIIIKSSTVYYVQTKFANFMFLFRAFLLVGSPRYNLHGGPGAKDQLPIYLSTYWTHVCWESWFFLPPALSTDLACQPILYERIRWPRRELRLAFVHETKKIQRGQTMLAD